MKETLPIILQKVSAGFPSPATDYIEEQIDLNKELIKKPSSTFLIRVQGNSMIDHKITEGEKKIVKKKEKYFLLSKKNNSTKEIEINTNLNTELWGVVTYVIHKL